MALYKFRIIIIIIITIIITRTVKPSHTLRCGPATQTETSLAVWKTFAFYGCGLTWGVRIATHCL